MKRINTILTIAALMAVMLVAGGLPASARASHNANCVGQAAAGGNAFEPRQGGHNISNIAQTFGGIGEDASSSCGGPG